MANTFSKIAFSESTNGKQILVAGTTSGSATPIHTAIAGTTSWDEVWLYAYNESNAAVNVSILWGGIAEPDNVSRVTVQPQSGRTLLIDGGIIQNSLVVSAYAQVTNVILISGYINRITPV